MRTGAEAASGGTKEFNCFLHAQEHRFLESSKFTSFDHGIPGKELGKPRDLTNALFLLSGMPQTQTQTTPLNHLNRYPKSS